MAKRDTGSHSKGHQLNFGLVLPCEGACSMLASILNVQKKPGVWVFIPESTFTCCIAEQVIGLIIPATSCSWNARV